MSNENNPDVPKVDPSEGADEGTEQKSGQLPGAGGPDSATVEVNPSEAPSEVDPSELEVDPSELKVDPSEAPSQ